MGSPGEPPTGRIYPDCTCAWKVPDVRCPWHGNATPTPPAPADAKCNAPGCSVCAAGLPHTTHSYPMTAPAPDDAVEEALTAAQALIRHLSQAMAGLARADGDMERLYFVPKIVAAYAEFNAVGAQIDAALRREKGGDK